MTTELLEEVRPAADALVAGWAAAASPPDDLTVSEWADQKRRLPETSASRGGAWRTDATPYLRGIMNAVLDPEVRQVALKKCHQSGGSEALNNIIGYFIEHDPCPMLVVYPTASAAEAWSKERLSDMIRTTPALRAVVREKRAPRGSHEAESTLALKMFPGGYLALGGANTPNTFARWSARVVIGDDVDRFPPVVGEEGDPGDLLMNRTTTFYNALGLFVSTPTLKGGRIDTLYERSDQRRFFITCPECGLEDWITWKGDCGDPKCGRQHFRVVFDDGDPETARIECPEPEHGGCGAHIDEATRRRLITEASEREDCGWRPTKRPLETGLVGFHLPAMVATLGDVTLPRLVEKWLSARSKGKESLRVFINTTLAEGWEDRGARMEPSLLFQRREDYGRDEAGEPFEVPAAAAALTAGVDVQEDRFELQVMAWGPADERWVVDWRTIPGNPKLMETRAALLEALQRRYRHALGVQLPIHATCIDTGYATAEMYDFVLAHQVRRIFATKGFGGKSGEPIVGKPSEKRYGKNPRPVRLFPINVDDAKTEVMAGLSLAAPGPGYIHFPAHLETINEEFFAQLCAEHRETRYNSSGVATHTIWVQDRDRNEALDTAVLCLAAQRLLNPNIRQMAESIAGAVASQVEQRRVDERTRDRGRPAPPPPPAAPSAPMRRVSRSSYLSR